MSISQIDLRTRFRNKFASKFNEESWSVSELYWSFIRDYPTGKVKKCLIQVSDDWRQEDLDKYIDWVDCKGINLMFDFEKYFKHDVNQRKLLLLEIIHKAMMSISVIESWDIAPLLDAYNSCKRVNLKYEFLVRNKIKTSPDKRHKCGLWCDWDIKYFRLYFLLFDKGENEIKRKQLFEKKPSEGEFVYYLNFKWVDKETIIIIDDYSFEKNNWEIKIHNI